MTVRLFAGGHARATRKKSSAFEHRKPPPPRRTRRRGPGARLSGGPYGLQRPGRRGRRSSHLSFLRAAFRDGCGTHGLGADTEYIRGLGYGRTAIVRRTVFSHEGDTATCASWTPARRSV